VNKGIVYTDSPYLHRNTHGRAKKKKKGQSLPIFRERGGCGVGKQFIRKDPYVRRLFGGEEKIISSFRKATDRCALLKMSIRNSSSRERIFAKEKSSRAETEQRGGKLLAHGKTTIGKGQRLCRGDAYYSLGKECVAAEGEEEKGSRGEKKTGQAKRALGCNSEEKGR